MVFIGALLCWAVMLQSTELLIALEPRPWRRTHSTTFPNLSFTRTVQLVSALQLILAITGLVGIFFEVPLFLVAVALLALTYALQIMWHGSFNGGSDGMTFHILAAWTLSLWRPEWTQVAVLYVMALTSTSYFTAGLAKFTAGGWWNGKALQNTLSHSPAVYPGFAYRLLNGHPWRLRLASSVVMAFELSFPIVIVLPDLRPVYLAAGVAFHIANYCLFGLNRFIWVWLAAYPAFM